MYVTNRGAGGCSDICMLQIEEQVVVVAGESETTEKKTAEKSEVADSSNITKRGAAHFGELEEVGRGRIDY